jgi:hypothetical protein
MKKEFTLTALISCLALTFVSGQQSRLIVPDKAKENPNPSSPGKIAHHPNDSTPSIYVWRINETTGERVPAIRDSIYYNFQQTTLPDGQSTATGHLGNVGSPSYSKIFFDNGETPEFYFWKAFSPYYKTPGKQLFYNTKIPYSNLYYQSGGGQTNKEERVKGEITTNLGKKLNLGFNIDYIYSRGFYESLSNKILNYNLYASYSGDRYDMHAWGGNYSFLMSENGGISNDLYITNPNSSQLPSTDYSSSEIPVNMTLTWNKLKGRQLFFTNRYHLGYYNKEKKHIHDKDTIVNTFVPIASFIYTGQFMQQNRRFNSYDSTFLETGKTARSLDALYANKYYDRPPDDRTSTWVLRNTFGISMREGFRDWVKFGFTAYLQNTIRRFSLPDSILGNYNKYNQNATAIGGVLSKTTGKHLRYDLNAQVSIVGYDMGEFKANGTLQTFIKIAGKEASLTATGYIKNLKPNFLEANVQSKYFWWNKSPGDIRRVYAGGELNLPQTATKLSIGVENIQNYQYFNADTIMDQHGGSVQVLSARLDQQLRAGILHWDNQLVYQTTSNASVIPLPQLSVYSNLYILTKYAKVLTLQIGIDAHYHTSYFAPGYEPALLGFYNQQNVKTGGFPMSTIYVNAHLKKTRFFVMYYNVLKNVGNNGYFSMPHYPVNPMVFKWGLSWDFNN